MPGDESGLIKWITSRPYVRSKAIHTNETLNEDTFLIQKEQLLWAELKLCNKVGGFFVLYEHLELQIVPKPFNISR